MDFFVILGGVLGGVWLFSLDRMIAGAVVGALSAVLWLRQIRLENRLKQLEKQLTRNRIEDSLAGQPSRQPVRPKPAVPEPDFVFELEEQPEFVQNSAAAEAHTEASPPPSVPATSIDSPEEKTPTVELWDLLVSYFTGGNVVVRVGSIVLFFGVAFLLKYSAERNIVPIELRLTGVGLCAVALLYFGWRLRYRRTGYALLLQGTAVGILFLTVFAAMYLYQLLPNGITLIMLVGLSILAAVLAILQEARSLAVFGIIGGFLAPLLTAVGGGSHIMLFSYYALLNFGILVIAWYRSWRELNLLGFLFTFAIGILWGSRNYHAGLFGSTESFLILFFLFYLAIGILFACKQPLNLKGYVDGIIIFGTPIVCFSLQVALVRPYAYGSAWSALALSCIYGGTALVLWKKGDAALRILFESFAAISVVFATVALPLALDGEWLSAAWALEGSAVVWIAVQQKRRLPRIFGLIVQVLSGFALLADSPHLNNGLALLNGFCLAGLLVAVAGFFSSYCLNRQRTQEDTLGLESTPALIWALLWWFGIGLHEIHTFAPFNYRPAAALTFCAGSCALLFFIGRGLHWPAVQRIYWGLLPVMALIAVSSELGFNRHPLIYGGWLVWPTAFSLHYLLLRRDEQREGSNYLKYPHPGLLVLLIVLTTWEAAWWADHWSHGAGVWTLTAFGLTPTCFVLGLCRLWNASFWPLRSFQREYLYYGPAPVIVYLWLGSLAANLTSTGDPWPFGYLPFLNPFDLTQSLVLFGIWSWTYVMTEKLGIEPFGSDRKMRVILAGATIFFWLNAVLIRTLHYWGKIPFRWSAMVGSDLVQTALSIFWTLSALVVMFWATRKGVRQVWLVGAGLIGVVIVKLFIFDLAQTSTVERIVSFIGVGALCLAIGYLAPLPPKPAED